MRRRPKFNIKKKNKIILDDEEEEEIKKKKFPRVWLKVLENGGNVWRFLTSDLTKKAIIKTIKDEEKIGTYNGITYYENDTEIEFNNKCFAYIQEKHKWDDQKVFCFIVYTKKEKHHKKKYKKIKMIKDQDYQ